MFHHSSSMRLVLVERLEVNHSPWDIELLVCFCGHNVDNHVGCPDIDGEQLGNVGPLNAKDRWLNSLLLEMIIARLS